jgi:hypothetical protein
MAQDHNDIYSIVERLRMLEEGLDKNERSVNQLSATFKPKTVSVLTSPKDPKNPLGGKMVGGCEESEEKDDTVLEAEMAEDVLEKVKSSFVDYLKSIEDKYKDSNLKDKTKNDTDLKAKDTKDRDLKVKETPVAEDPTELDPADTDENPTEPVDEPTYAESAPVKTINNECGLWEMHGNEQAGFEIRRGGRSLPSRFKNLDEAELAVEMFTHRRRKADEAQDYMEER